MRLRLPYFVRVQAIRLGLAFHGLCLAAAVAAQTAPSPSNTSGQAPASSLFNNGVRSPADYGSLPVPSMPAGKPVDTQAPGHYFFADDLTRLPDVRHYRVVALSVASELRRPRIVGPELDMPRLGTAPRRAYLNLGDFQTQAEARQFVLDFFELNKDFIDANFVIRKHSASPRMHRFQVDLGPFSGNRHALIFCRSVVQRTTMQTPCAPTLQFQSKNEKDAFTGQATLGLSMGMIQRVMAANDFQDFNNLLDATVDVSEGESLSRGDFLVVKIMRRGVFLARETGPTFLLPADAIPMPTPAEAIPDSPAPRPGAVGTKPGGS